MRTHHLTHLAGILALAAVVTSAGLAYANRQTNAVVAAPVMEEAPIEESPSVELSPEPQEFPNELKPADPIPEPTKLGLPMKNALDRVTKKHFGMEIHPETSPVQNDRFNGFHVGVDFEVFEDEQNVDMEVFAICDGPLVSKNFANGYGGFALQNCELEGERVQVIYGHMDLKSIAARPGEMITRGQLIGVLGEGYSEETDGVRKHLHLGIHRGEKTDIRGYVQKPEEIDHWLDAIDYLK